MLFANDLVSRRDRTYLGLQIFEYCPRTAEHDQQERFTAALEAAMERSLATHAERLAEMTRRVEEQAAAVLAPLAGLGV